MGFLTNTLSAIAPGWAASRAKNRLKLQAYEAAMPSRLHKARREGRSANTAVGAAGRSLREQARWLDENHDIAIGMLDKMEERVVGANGIQVEPQPLGLDGEVHEEFAQQLASLWSEWSVSPDVTGMYTRPEMERILLRSALRDGEVFTQIVRGAVPDLKYPTPVKMALEMLEADFVPLQGVTGPNIRQGVIVNRWGRPIGYQVYENHPAGCTGFTGKLRTITAENMVHLATRKRLHQIRGVSFFHGVITRLADIKDYEEAERVGARIAASLGFYIKRGEGSDFEDGQASGGDGDRRFDISPGMIFDDLAPGEDLGVIESNRPNVHINEFRNSQLKAAAAGTRGSYSTIARDYNGSYSAQRQELVEGFEGYYVLQNWFVGQYSRRIYRAWLDMALLSGIKIPADVDRSSLRNAIYLGPVMPWIDPVKEADGYKKNVRGGAATEAEWVRARGKSPSEVKRQRKREMQYNRENGLIFDSDAANDKGAVNDTDTSANPTGSDS